MIPAFLGECKTTTFFSVQQSIFGLEWGSWLMRREFLPPLQIMLCSSNEVLPYKLHIQWFSTVYPFNYLFVKFDFFFNPILLTGPFEPEVFKHISIFFFFSIFSTFPPWALQMHPDIEILSMWVWRQQQGGWAHSAARLSERGGYLSKLCFWIHLHVNMFSMQVEIWAVGEKIFITCIPGGSFGKW